MNDSEEEKNDLIQYKRLVFKLEEEIKKKDSENLLLIKLNNDLKSLCDNIQNESTELNSKLLFQYSEIKRINKSHQEEIKNINFNFEKQKQIYEDKIKQLCANNTLNQKIKMEKEIEMRYEEKIKSKDTQIEILNKTKNRLEKDKKELQSEIEELKLKRGVGIKIEKNENNNLMDNINLNEKEDEIDKSNKIIKELQNIINNKEEKISELAKELNNIKKEKNDYENIIAKKYYFNKNELLDAQNKNKLLLSELDKKEKELINIKEKLINLQNWVDEKNKNINNLYEEKNKLLIEYEKLKENEEINNEYFQNQLDALKNLIKKNEKDVNLNILTNEKLRRKNEEKNNSKINQLEKQLEEEKLKDNIMESNQSKSNNLNDSNLIKEKEKENKIIKYDKDTNIFKMEYENIKEQYDLLLVDYKLSEKKIKKKEEENEYLKNCINEMISKKHEKKIYYKELRYKYRNLLNKKENYKDLCKIARKNMENLISLMTPQQKEQIEKSENKYLIDTSSFSFTELY